MIKQRKISGVLLLIYVFFLSYLLCWMGHEHSKSI